MARCIELFASRRATRLRLVARLSKDGSTTVTQVHHTALAFASPSCGSLDDKGHTVRMDGIRLLVVEDDLAVSAMWVDLFTESGAEVLGPCGSSAQALTLLASQRPDVALLDIELRDGESFPVARALRAMGVPFVFLSSCDPSDLPPELAGAPYLRKPSNAREVFASLLTAAASTNR